MERPPRLTPDDPRLAGRHLLALPDGATPEQLESFARSRFAGVSRQPSPEPDPTTRGRTSRASGMARTSAPGVDVLRLSRHSSMEGPFALTDDDAARLGLPAGAVAAFVVRVPRERGEPAYPGGDRDGLKRVLGAAMPVRDEDRVLRWLVDVARRLGGALRLADDDGGAVLVPDPAAAVDLTVWSGTRLAPEWALAAVRAVSPTTRLAGSPDPTVDARPPAAVEPAPLPAPAADLGERRRRRLLERVAAADAAALGAPSRPTGYGLETHLGDDGLVVVEVGEEEVLPLALSTTPDGTDPDRTADLTANPTTYRVRWEPPDVEDLEREHAAPAHRASRDRARTLVRAIAGALHGVGGGVVLDDVELPVDPASLGPRPEGPTNAR